MQESDFGLSAQVLQEFYVTVTRKIRRPLSPETAVALMDEYLAAAEALDAPTLYTEDLQHGQRYGRVRAVNPFLAG